MNKSTLLLGGGAYLVAVNAGSAYLFFYDKQIALHNEKSKHNQQMRVPEKMLCATALVGGWIGGMYNVNV